MPEHRSFQYTIIYRNHITHNYTEAITFAMKHKVSVYDASYHVLAGRLGCRFLTADRRFWEKVKGLGVAELLGA